MRSYSFLNFVAANSFEALWIFSGFARNFQVNKFRAVLLKCLVICHRAIYSVNTFTRYSEGALRLIRLCGGASYEHRTQEPDPGVFRPSRFDPFRQYSRIHILYTWVIARAATISDLGYCRYNRRDCCGLPIIGRRADNPPLRLLGFLCSPSNALPICATSSSDRKVSLVFPSSCLRKGTIFLCTRIISEK